MLIKPPPPLESPRFRELPVCPPLNAPEEELLIYLEGRYSTDAGLRDQMQSLLDVGAKISSKTMPSIFALRSQDVFTTLIEGAEGYVPARVPAVRPIMGKGSDEYLWFNRNPAHLLYKPGEKYYSQVLPEGEVPSDFYQLTTSNAFYGQSISLASFFSRQVTPKLKSDWTSIVESQLKNLRIGEGLANTFGNIVEDFIVELQAYLSAPTSARVKFKIHQVLRDIVLDDSSDNFNHLLTALEIVHNTRAGVQIFFKDTILAYCSDVLHDKGYTIAQNNMGIECDTNEVVLKPKIPNGIPFNKDTVLGIVPLGEYEEGIFKRLGFKLDN